MANFALLRPGSRRGEIIAINVLAAALRQRFDAQGIEQVVRLVHPYHDLAAAGRQAADVRIGGRVDDQRAYVSRWRALSIHKRWSLKSFLHVQE